MTSGGRPIEVENHDHASPDVCSIAALTSWFGGTFLRITVMTLRPANRIEAGASTVPLPAKPLGVNAARVGASTAKVKTYVPVEVIP